MIPADVASRLRLITPEQPAAPQALTPVKQLSDVLAELVPGQRLMAEIQALLPNGAYRAIIAQRDVTLALPFSAKPGDTLELEVVESDGKLSLAFVGKRGGEQPADAATQSVPTRLSQAGRLIGDILAGVDGDGKKAPPAPLNANQPLIDKMPASARELIPVLREALGRSGMFYEAHQARWVEGKLPAEFLLQQPQGRLSPALQDPALHQRLLQTDTHSNSHQAPAPGSHGSAPATASAATAFEPTALPDRAAAAPHSPEATAHAIQSNKDAATANASQSERAQPLSPQPSGPAIRQELTPLVQQQLDALASQNFVWQGQVWPGQNMHWEIREDEERRRENPEDAPERWHTRLQLNLPNLGGIDARIRLVGNNAVEIDLTAASENGHISLSAAANELRQQLEEAGLNLAQWTLKHGETAL